MKAKSGFHEKCWSVFNKIARKKNRKVFLVLKIALLTEGTGKEWAPSAASVTALLSPQQSGCLCKCPQTPAGFTFHFK